MELMVVLVVFGMLIGLAIPSYSKYAQTQQLRGASENLVQTIQLQRAKAMATGQSVTINFNTAVPAGWTCMSAGRSNRMLLSNGISYVSATPNQLVLSRDGRVNTSGVVIFRNITGNSDTVSVMLSGLALIR